MRLLATARAWGTPAFPAVLKRELAEQAAALPLQQALAHSSAVAAAPLTCLLLDARAEAAVIHVKVGVFFSGIVAGCSCSGDPSLDEPLTEYGEFRLEIQPETGATVVRLVA